MEDQQAELLDELRRDFERERTLLRYLLARLADDQEPAEAARDLIERELLERVTA